MKNRVRELRTEAGLTQQQLAELVHVSSRTIISLEKGQYNPSLLLAYRLALVFHTTVEELYCLRKTRNWRTGKMRTGHKRQLAGGILGLLAGFGLVLRACLTGQWRVSLTALAVGGGLRRPSGHLRQPDGAAAGQEEECTA